MTQTGFSLETLINFLAR